MTMTGEAPAWAGDGVDRGFVAPVPGSRARRPALVALAALVAVGAAYLWYAGRIDLRVAATGVVYETPGVIRADRDAVTMWFGGPTVSAVRLRVPVQNPGRLPLHVTYPVDLAPVFTGTPDEPTQQVRIAPGETVWLEVLTSSRGCVGAPATNSGSTTYSSIEVTVRPPGARTRVQWIDLPVGFGVAGADDPQACRERS